MNNSSKTTTHTPWEVKSPFRGLDHAVGLNFGPDGRLYAGGELGQVYIMKSGTEKPEELARTGGFVGGLVVDGNHNVYACDSAKKSILKITQKGGVETFCSGYGMENKSLVLPNYCLFDDNGNLYFSDSGPQGSYADYWKASGRIIRVSSEKKAESVAEGLYFPSGLALSPDGTELFVIQSSAANVLRIQVKSNGSLTAPEVYAQLPYTVPEGIAIASSGEIYVSCYRPDAIYKIDPHDRRVALVIRDDTSEIMNRVTNIAFPPDGGATIYFANMGGWHIGSLGVESGGMKLRYPKLD